MQSLKELYIKFNQYCHELNQLGISPEEYTLFGEARTQLALFNFSCNQGQTTIALNEIQKAHKNLDALHDQLEREGKMQLSRINQTVRHLEETTVEMEKAMLSHRT